MHERSSLELPIQSQIQSFSKRSNRGKQLLWQTNPDKQAVKTEGTRAKKQKQKTHKIKSDLTSHREKRQSNHR